MKTKKLVMAVVAVTMSASSALAFAGCHEHEYKWTDITPATCENAGEQKGVCDCGDTVTREVEAKGHNYGDWKISKAPTPNVGGKAVKACSNDDGCAVIAADLPKLTIGGDGYDDYKETATDYGVPLRTYKLNNSNGNVELDLSVAFSLDEAIKLAVHNQPKAVGADIVRQSKMLVNLNNPNINQDLIPDEDKIVPPDWEGYFYANSSAEIKYEKSDNYMGLVDQSEKIAKYYTKNPDGSIFAVNERYVGGGSATVLEYVTDDDDHTGLVKRPDLDPTGTYWFNSDGTLATKETEQGREIPVEKQIIKENDPQEKFFDGSDFYFVYYHGSPADRQYGVADFVNMLYSYANNNANSGFSSSSEALENGNTKWSFTYGEASTETTTEKSLCVFEVSFELDTDNVMVDASVSCKTYVGNKFVDLDNGQLVVKEGKEDCWKICEQYSVSQSSSYESGVAPTNPYKYEDMLLTSFGYSFGKFMYSDPVKGESVYSSITPDKNGVYEFNPNEGVSIFLENIEPADKYNLYFDPVQIFLYDANTDNLVEEIIMDQNRSTEGHFDGTLNRDNGVFSFKSLLAGEYKLVMKTANLQKEAKINVPFIAPTEFVPNVYSYDEIQQKSTWVPAATDKEVYEGQSLYFNSYCAHPFYEDKSYTVNVTKGGLNVTADVMSEDEVEGQSVSKFNATTAGEYTVTLTSNTGAVKTSFKVTVNAAPVIGELLTGTYSNSDAVVSVEFTPESSGATAGALVIDLNGDTINANYAYDSATGNVNLTDVTGATGDNLNFHLEITEAFNLFLVYENDKGKETKIYVSKGSKNNLVGSFVMTDMDNAIAHTCNVAGTYTVTLNASAMVLYKIGDGNIDYKMAQSFTITLNEGDVFKIWCTGTSVKSYTIAINE